MDRNDETAQDTVIYTRLGKLIRALGENSRRWSLKDEQGMGQWFVEEFSSRSQRREAAAALMERLDPGQLWVLCAQDWEVPARAGFRSLSLDSLRKGGSRP